MPTPRGAASLQPPLLSSQQQQTTEEVDRTDAEDTDAELILRSKLEGLASEAEAIQKMYQTHHEESCRTIESLNDSMRDLVEKLRSLVNEDDVAAAGIAEWSDTRPVGEVVAEPGNRQQVSVVSERLTTRAKPSLMSQDVVDDPLSRKFRLSAAGNPELMNRTELKFTLSTDMQFKKPYLGAFRIHDSYQSVYILNEAKARDVYDKLHRSNVADQQNLSRSGVQNMFLFRLTPLPRQLSPVQGDQDASRCKLRFSPLHPQGTRHLIWDIAAMVFVMIDSFIIPLMIAWPGDSWNDAFMTFYFFGGICFWSFDILLSFCTCVYKRGELVASMPRIAKAYLKSWFCLDAIAVILDVLVRVLASGANDQRLAAIRVVRLLRLRKYTHIMVSLQDVCSLSGRTWLIYAMTISSIIFTVLFTVHFLACLMFFIGQLEVADPVSWINRYSIHDYGLSAQYMWSFHWILSQFTPAPFHFRPGTETEQAFVLIVICTTIPLMGAQIGRVTGTINQINEKSKEQNKMKRDLQKYLHQTNAPMKLRVRTLRSLEHAFLSKLTSLNAPPAVLSLLSHSLITELHASQKSDVIIKHPLFKLILEPVFEFTDLLVQVFQVHSTGVGDCVFKAGSVAKGMHIITHGTFQQTRPMHEALGDIIGPVSWLSEVGLFSEVVHATTLVALDIGQIFLLTPDDFSKILHQSPALAVAVYEYALALSKRAKQHDALFYDDDGGDTTRVRVEDALPPDWSEEAVAATQLYQLLNAGDTIAVVRSERQPGRAGPDSGISSAEIDEDVGVFLARLRKSDLDASVVLCENFFSELGERGIYQRLHHGDEQKRSLLAVLSANWLTTDNYEAMIASQNDLATRLRHDTWVELQRILQLCGLSQAGKHAVMLCLALRGLGKSSVFLRLCKPSCRTAPEDAILYAVQSLQEHLPSVRRLDEETSQLTLDILEIQTAFSFAQFLQAENCPAAVAQLGSVIRNRRDEAFKCYLLAQFSMMCGLTGAQSLHGSCFLTELNAQGLLLGLNSLKDIANIDGEANGIYWSYIVSRAAYFDVKITGPSDMALARLLCLTRATTGAIIDEVSSAWHNLNASERDLLGEFLLVDGLQFKACTVKFLPLFLANARANPFFGFFNALRVFITLLRKISSHGIMSMNASVVVADIFSITSIVSDVQSYHAFEKCVEFAELLQDGSRLTLVLTAESRKILKGRPHDDRTSIALQQILDVLPKLESHTLPKKRHHSV